jgi:hypothetical protein
MDIAAKNSSSKRNTPRPSAVVFLCLNVRHPDFFRRSRRSGFKGRVWDGCKTRKGKKSAVFERFLAPGRPLKRGKTKNISKVPSCPQILK